MIGMLNIQRSADEGVAFFLSGRIEIDDVPELERLLSLEASGEALVLDLGNVTLISRDAVKFLTRCEEDGIKLKSCPAYIREWIDAEKGPNGPRT